MSGRRTVVGTLSVICVLGVLALPSLALADTPSITFVAPPGSLTYPPAGQTVAGFDSAPAIRTTDTMPVIGIEANGGAQLQCYALDDVQITATCGPALPGCQAQLCASFQPTSPLSSDESTFYGRYHFLPVQLLDADGDALASESVDIDVSPTAPTVSIDNHGGVLNVDSQTLQKRTDFYYSVSDNGYQGLARDTVDCSDSPVGAAPVWWPCNGSADSAPDGELGTTLTGFRAVHRPLLVQVRITDDFGRSSIASAQYDPVPCTARVSRPASLARLAASGVRVRLRCDATYVASMALFTYALNGHRYVKPKAAPAAYKPLVKRTVRSSRSSFTVNAHLRLKGSAARFVRRQRSAGFVLIVGPPKDVISAMGNFPSYRIAYPTFTVRH